MAKIYLFAGLGEERRTPRTTSRPRDHGSTRYLRGCHLYSLALPNTKRAGRGLIRCRHRRPIVAWLVLDNVLTVQRFRRVQPREQIILKKQSLVSRFLHSGGTRMSSADVFFWIVWKENFATSRLHCHRPNLVLGFWDLLFWVAVEVWYFYALNFTGILFVVNECGEPFGTHTENSVLFLVASFVGLLGIARGCWMNIGDDVIGRDHAYNVSYRYLWHVTRMTFGM